MRRISGGLAGGGAFLLLALACNPEKPVEPRSPTFDAAETLVAPLVLHTVAPQTTDPAIDRALDNHYVWLDTTAKSNRKLFVFLPGTGQNPSIFQLVQQEAARLGYHVIGLMYPTGGGLAKACPTTPDPSACYENARLEIIDGIDRVAFLNVSVANSIDNRLTKLLQYLALQYPDEGWDRFLLRDKPKWSQIAVSGHSQGGGNAAMIAKIRLVARVVLFSSVTDSIQTEAPSWVATHVTPVERYYGIAHDRDGFYRPIRAALDSLGLDVFGGPAMPETSSPPYDGTHMLVTDLLPRPNGFVGTNEAVRPRQQIGDEHVRSIVRRAAGLGHRGTAEDVEPEGVQRRPDRAIEPVAIVRDAVVALHRRHVRRDPGRGFGLNAVRHGGEQDHAGNQPDLRDHRRVPTSLGVATDGDLRPLRLVTEEESVPPFVGILSRKVLEQLGESVVDAVRHADVQERDPVDSVDDLEACVLVARAGIKGRRARFRQPAAGWVHEADDVVAEPGCLLLHELKNPGILACTGQEYEELMVRARGRVEPHVVIVEPLVDRAVGRLGRDDVQDERWRRRGCGLERK